MHEFKVWAPNVSRVAVKTNDGVCPMQGPDATGWWSAKVESAGPGTDYAFLLDDDPTPYPDPRSARQPTGVHMFNFGCIWLSRQRGRSPRI